MILHEPWATRGKLRDALAEAAASYASEEAAASAAARAEAATAEQAPPTARQAPVSAATTEDDGHAARLRAVAAERDRYLDHLQRLKAEFENYRKRVQRDNEALVLRAGEGVIESLLPVVDNMQRALGSAERHEEGQLIKGVELVAGRRSRAAAPREAERVQERLRRAGVIVGLCGAEHNVLKINPPLCASIADVATLATACDQALAQR